MINKGIWDDLVWNAVGVSICGGYSTLWFGEEPDPTGSPLEQDEVEKAIESPKKEESDKTTEWGGAWSLE